MQRRSTILPIAALAAGLLTLGIATSCRRGDDARNDSALNRDLNLVPSDSTLMIVSPQEQLRLNAERARATSGTAATTSGRVYRSSGGEVARSTAPAASRVVKHTKRDAAIGAVAGAVIGGATHGAKGAVIGGATGGVVGAIIGNNVDKKKKKP